MHDLSEGDVVQISEPRNHFPLVRGARRSVLFAGGIGVTPILCMAEQLASEDEHFEMHYCARSAAKTAFLDRIAAAGFASRVQFHFDDGEAAQQLDLDRALGELASDAHLYVCGPAGFIDFVIDGAKSRGWRDEQIHFEFFSAAQPDAGATSNMAFDVKIASTGQIVHVPGNMTVTAALEKRGIEIPTSCEQGVCGTCVTRILEGCPDHRDLFLTDAEKARNDQFTPCCSRSTGDMLVLDL